MGCNRCQIPDALIFPCIWCTVISNSCSVKIFNIHSNYTQMNRFDKFELVKGIYAALWLVMIGWITSFRSYIFFTGNIINIIMISNSPVTSFLRKFHFVLDSPSPQLIWPQLGLKIPFWAICRQRDKVCRNRPIFDRFSSLLRGLLQATGSLRFMFFS